MFKLFDSDLNFKQVYIFTSLSTIFHLTKQVVLIQLYITCSSCFVIYVVVYMKLGHHLPSCNDYKL